MKTPALFKKFNYSITPTALPGKTVKPCNASSNETSLVNVNIDFEQEDFSLEGDWQYMMSSNKHAEKKWFNFNFHQQRVSIKANIYPGLAIDLSDDNNDGQVFIIESTIKDDDCTGVCSGLLVLDKIAISDKTNTNKWNISFYLYDTAHDDCEISFRFLVYGRPANELLN